MELFGLIFFLFACSLYILFFDIPEHVDDPIFTGVFSELKHGVFSIVNTVTIAAILAFYATVIFMAAIGFCSIGIITYEFWQQ